MKILTLLHPAFLVSFLVLVGAAASLEATVRIFDFHLQKKPIQPQSGLTFSSLPTDFPSWHRLHPDQQLSVEVIDELGTENYLSRWYTEKDPGEGREPRVFELHLAYYTGVIDAVPHVPERCFVGGGMTTAGGTQRDLSVPLDLSSLILNESDEAAFMSGPVYMARSPERHDRVNLPVGVDSLKMTATPFTSANGSTIWAGYFFIANGGTVSSADQVRLLAFQLEDDYAYYAKVQFLSSGVSSADELATLAADALDEMFADIMRCLPDWTEVEAGVYPPE
ncbi:MAG: exosortase-associated EpsI family protein [Planctomycetota bacterium]